MSRKSINFAPSNTDGLLNFDYNEGSKEKLTKNYFGVVLEWLKRHAWKACIRQKRIPSSNLGHSAR